MKIRVGHGFDVHRLVSGRPLIIGGVTIPFDKGAEGHSDADVLVHAICDALLGAAALKDIGYHFPDNNPAYKGIDSLILLKETAVLIQNKGYIIQNIDSTVCLQAPKIGNYTNTMRKIIGDVIQLDIEDISVKATTTEKLGFIGLGEGISAHAVVLLLKQ